MRWEQLLTSALQLLSLLIVLQLIKEMEKKGRNSILIVSCLQCNPGLAVKLTSQLIVLIACEGVKEPQRFLKGRLYQKYDYGLYSSVCKYFLNEEIESTVQANHCIWKWLWDIDYEWISERNHCLDRTNKRLYSSGSQPFRWASKHQTSSHRSSMVCCCCSVNYLMLCVW